MKYLFIFLAMISMSLSAKAQEIKNYNQTGKVFKSKTDFLLITSDTILCGGNKSPLDVGSIVTSIVSLGVDIFNNVETNRQAKFTASYSNNMSIILTPCQYKAFLGGNNINITLDRYMIDNMSSDFSTQTLAAKYYLEISNFGGVFILKLDSFQLNKSKAKVKNSKEDLNIALDFKIMSYFSTNSGSSDSTKQDNSTQDLGENILRIPIAKFDEKKVIIQQTDNSLLAKNSLCYFKSIPAPSKNAGNLVINIAAIVTESNNNHLSQGEISSNIKTNSSDIIAVLKSFFSTGSSNSSSKN